jgi:hypothetical protein
VQRVSPDACRVLTQSKTNDLDFFSSYVPGNTVRLALEVLVRFCIDAESGLHPLFVVFTLGFESCQDIRVTPDRCPDRVPGQPHRCSFEELLG